MDGFTQSERKNAVYIMASFVAMFCWYTAYFREIDESPVMRLLQARGVNGEPWEEVVLLSAMASMAFCMLFIKNQNLPRYKPIWLAVHILAFVLIQCTPFLPTKEWIYIMGMLSGVLLGAVINRVFYSVFFAISKIHPARIIALAYLFIQIFIHAYTILPIARIPVLYYGLEAVTLLLFLVFSYRFDGNEMEARRLLPENKINPADMLPILLFIFVMQACFCVYEIHIWPRLDRGIWLDTLQILPNAATLLAMFFFCGSLTIGKSLRIFLILFTCGVTAYLLLDGASQRAMVDAFIQPAFLFADLFYLWMIYSIFFTYGNKRLRLRIFLCSVLLSHFAANLLLDRAFDIIPPQMRYVSLVFPMVMLLLLLIPFMERFIANAENQRSYVESQGGESILLPPQREAIQQKRDRILAALPRETAFTAVETDVLAYLLDNHDFDTMAYFMDIPLKEARQHVGSILRKCDVDNQSALMQRLGELQNAKGDFDAIAAQYGLAQREKEVVSLLLQGLTLRQVAPEMNITFSTVSTYSKTIYKKLGINSRGELFMLFGKQPEREEAATGSS